LEELRVLCWSAFESVLKGGAAVEFSDISEVKLTDEGTKELDRENVMKLVTKKGEFAFAFKTYQEASDWAIMLGQVSKS
jgi:hypothetical protein